MKFLKMFGLAVAAALALTAFIGASSASATVLCKTNLTTGCAAAGWDYAAGTELDASLELGSSTTFTTTGEKLEITCIGGTIKGTMTTGGASETVHGPVSGLTFEVCNSTVDVLELGELEVHNIAGTSNGTLIAKGFKLTMNVGGFACTYTTGESTDLGTITGGPTATLDITAVINRFSNIFCPSDLVWRGRYTFTSPEPLYVSAS